MNTILLVDLNSYFATVEQQQNPHLRGKPVGIVKEIGRRCIIAASKEAKKLGIKTGSDLVEARKLAPRLVLIKADFDKYSHYTKKFLNLIESFSPDINLFSLDEAFVDASRCLSLYGSAEALAVKIQERIFKDLGDWVTASVGISRNRMLAKLASEFAPHGGYFKIDRHNLDLALSLSKVSDVCGIGPALSQKLSALGITNILKIRDLEDNVLKTKFGPFWGPELKRMSWGETSHVLRILDQNQKMKGVGRTVTGYRLCNSEKLIRQTIRNLIEEVTLKMRQMDLAGRHLSIFLQGEEQTWYRHRTLKYYVRHPDVVFHILYQGFYQKWQRSFEVIRYGVRIDQLKPIGELTQCWLPEWNKRERVWRAIDQVNQKYGLFTLRPGTLLKSPLILPEVTGYLGDKLYQFRQS